MTINPDIQAQAMGAAASMVLMPDSNTTFSFGPIGENIKAFMGNSNVTIGAIVNEYVSSHTAGEDVSLNVQSKSTGIELQ